MIGVNVSGIEVNSIEEKSFVNGIYQILGFRG